MVIPAVRAQCPDDRTDQKRSKRSEQCPASQAVDQLLDHLTTWQLVRVRVDVDVQERLHDVSPWLSAARADAASRHPAAATRLWLVSRGLGAKRAVKIACRQI